MQENAAKKVDIVKIWVDDRMGTVKKLSPELYSAVIDEAHKHGLRVIAHIYTLEDAKAHAARRPRRVRARRARQGSRRGVHGARETASRIWCSDRTCPIAEWWPTSTGCGRASPAAEFETLQKGNTDRPDAQAFWAIQARNLAKMNAAGVRIVVGTDGNTPYAPHVEMADMVAAGMTPMQVIVAATRNGAQFLKMTDTGTIEANKSADFLVLDANPLDDITNTRTISSVYLRGAAVDRSSYKSAAGRVALVEVFIVG